MKVEVSYGEVVDKVAILLLKQQHISDPEKLANVERELAALRGAWTAEGLTPMEELAAWSDLCAVNAQLWAVEDDLRDLERQGSFGDEFVRLARAVYFTNDRRAALKRDVNLALGSRLVEEKSYARYDRDEPAP